MKFIPNSVHKTKMLQELGLKTINDLFTDLPSNIPEPTLNLQKTQTQQTVEHTLKKISQLNQSAETQTQFLAGGIKPHYIPAAIASITNRSEFYSAYTPYQAEASQGFLQAMFEYQSMICELTGMDVANASLYDGATAIGEAALMAMRITRKKTFLIPTNIKWDKRCILKNYTKGAGMTIKELPHNTTTGTLDHTTLEQHLTDDVAGLYIENPNFFGIFETNLQHLKTKLTDHNILFIVGIDPLSLGIIKSPGSYGADIVLGEGRALGNPMDFGGSGLGLFACKKQYLRQIPGRVIGQTHDTKGNSAYCMTLQTREQHIRRGRATSNICTNEGLNSLTALIYLSLIGQNGLHEISLTNFTNGKNLAQKIWELPNCSQVFSGLHFNEFVVKCKNLPAIRKSLKKHNIQAGIDLSEQYPELKNCLLFGVTETHTPKQQQQLITAMKEAS